MKYWILEANSADSLTEKVLENIIVGWVPIGGVSVSDWIYTEREDGWDNEVLASRYSQAMIKKEDGDK